MKKKLLTLFSVLAFFYPPNELSAQDFITPAASKEIATSSLRNTVVTIDNQTFDYRILKHYSEADLNSMSVVKRNQVHYIYTESYRVLNIENCSSLKISDIDVAKIEALRKEDASSIVSYGTDCKVQVELISRNALQLKMAELNK